MKKCIFILLLGLATTSLAAPVTFNDPNLKAAVETQLGILNPDPTQMLGLIVLDANSLGISDLTGLDYATNLTTLHLSNNNLGNIDLLAGLTKMQYLYLNGNSAINSLLALTDMNDLRRLRAQDCSISNINVASNFTKLESLNLNNNNIFSIAPIQNINTLRSLYLVGNNIADINVFTDPDMSNLKELDLSDNFVADINALSGLINLINLQFRYNSITDINALANLNKLIYLYASYNDNITNLTVLSDMNSLVELGLTDVNLNDISLLGDVNHVQILWLGSNQIVDILSLKKYYNLTTLSVSNNPLNFDSRCQYLREIVYNNPGASIAPSISSQIKVNPGDKNDLQIFADQWLNSGCGMVNAYCQCCDIDETGLVNFVDYAYWRLMIE